MEGKTLRELDVRPGDVVELTEDCRNGGDYAKRYAGVRLVANDMCETDPHDLHAGVSTPDGKIHFWYLCGHGFRIISRTADTPRPWRELTGAEKGALLLARENGAKIEVLQSDGQTWCDSGGVFSEGCVHRVKPMKTITLDYDAKGNTVDKAGSIAGHMCTPGYKITFETVDGEPVLDSIQMERIND